MKRALFGFCLCTPVAYLAISSWHQVPSTASATPASKQETASPDYSELILELPEDGGAWWVTVCLPANHHADAASRWLLAALSVEPRLQSLQAQCKNYQFIESDPMYQAKWATYIGELPALLIQMPDGKTCFKVSGDRLPNRPERLANEIAQAIEECRPCPRPAPEPTPQPSPAPLPAPIMPRPIPDIRPQPSSSEGEQGVALPALLAGLVGAAAGAASEWRKSNQA